MGTTLTAMLATDDQLTLAHIGDSRAYRLRDGALEQLTHDHTLVQSLIDEGQITEEEALTHPRRSWILRALDGRGSPEVDLTDRSTPQPGDRLPGLQRRAVELRRRGRHRARASRAMTRSTPRDRLVDLALQAGGSDNISCVVADPVDDDRATTASRSSAARSPSRRQPTAARPASTDRHRSRRDAPSAATRATAAQHRPSARGRRRPGRHPGRRRRSSASTVYIHHQWYVATVGGQGRGLPRRAGQRRRHQASHLHGLTNIPVTALPQDDRERVVNGIQASGGADRCEPGGRQPAQRRLRPRRPPRRPTPPADATSTPTSASRDRRSGAQSPPPTQPAHHPGLVRERAVSVAAAASESARSAAAPSSRSCSSPSS